MNLKLPSIATIIAGGALAALVALNDQVFHFGQPWQTGLTIAITWAGVLGISVLSGGAFRAAIHVTQPIAAAIASTLTALQLLLMQSAYSSAVKTVLQVVIVIGGTLGFGPDTVQKISAAAKRRREAKAPRRVR